MTETGTKSQHCVVQTLARGPHAAFIVLALATQLLQVTHH